MKNKLFFKTIMATVLASSLCTAIIANIGPSFWNRRNWHGWEAPYWGPRGLWLGFHSHWKYRQGMPHIYNETGERIKLHISISNLARGTYTLTVVTESGQTKEFPGLETPDMRKVEVFIDQSGNLQVAPR